MMQENITPKHLRSFGIIIGAIFAGIGAWPLLWGEPARLWAFAPSVLLIPPALVAPMLLRIPFRAWMAFGRVLGRVNSVLVLGILFFVIFTPIALCLRVFRRDLLRLKFDKSAASYKVPVDPRDPDHVFHPY